MKKAITTKYLHLFFYRQSNRDASAFQILEIYLRIFVLSLFIFFSQIIKAQQIQSAEDILKEAFQQAVKENKKVFVMFHASWWAACVKMDTAMNDKSVKIFFDENFIITHLTVHESKGKEKLETPGAFEILAKYKGEKLGLPFWLIFDKKKEFVGDSPMRIGYNVGCPSEKNEIDYFIKVFKKTTSITDKQEIAVEKRFSKLPIVTINQ